MPPSVSSLFLISGFFSGRVHISAHVTTLNVGKAHPILLRQKGWGQIFFSGITFSYFYSIFADEAGNDHRSLRKSILQNRFFIKTIFF